MEPTNQSDLATVGLPGSRPMLHLLDDPYLTMGDRRLEIPEGSKRLVAFVALQPGAVDRRRAAGVLWPKGSEARASGNLRSALWRLNSAGVRVLRATKHAIALNADVVVDVTLLTEWARRLITGATRHEDLETIPWSYGRLELLPGWYDDWALLERERINQRVVHALERQSLYLTERARYAEAIEAALLAVGADPFRESTRECLIRAHLAEGNRVAGRRCLNAYRALLRQELAIEPSPQLVEMVEDPAGPEHFAAPPDERSTSTMAQHI